MMRDKVIEHRFVESFPEVLKPGVLYISLEYGSVAHSCCCGCGEEVVTPLTPTDWKITFDGETVTLHPSIGSWTLRCRSHYVIRRNHVIEAPPWSDTRVAAERQRDRQAKARYFKNDAFTPVAPHCPEPTEAPSSTPPPPPSWWQRLRVWWKTT